MAPFLGFDINTPTTPKPWGTREYNYVQESLQTICLDTIAGVKDISGHKHGKLYNISSVALIDTVTSGSIELKTNTNVTGNLDVTGQLYGNLYDLYGNLAIQTRHLSKVINFYPAVKGGYDFNVDTSIYSFRIHDDSTELFLIGDLLGTPTTQVNTLLEVNGISELNGNTFIDGDLDVTGTITYGSLSLSGNLAMSTYFINYDGSNDVGLSFDVSNNAIIDGDLTVNGTIRYDNFVISTNIALASFFVNYDGTDNHGISFDASNNTIINDNLGIGINPPEGKLHIYSGNSTASIPSTTDELIIENSTDTGMCILTPDTAISRIYFTTPSDVSGSVIQWDYSNGLFTLGASSSGAETVIRTGNDPDAIHINSIGNVGINIDIPDGKVHIHSASAGTVSANGNADELVLENSANCGMSILSPDTNYSILYFGSPSDNSGAQLYWRYSDLTLKVGSAISGGELALNYGDSVEAIRINNIGNVGIGTDNPDSKVHIYSGNSGVTTPPNSQFILENSTTAIMALLSPDANSTIIYFGSASDEIGARVQYNHNAYLMSIGTHLTDGELGFFTDNNVEAVRIDSNGNVGINNTIPSSYDFSSSSILAIGDTDESSSIVSVVSNSTGIGYLTFADGTSGGTRYAGMISYDHANDLMQFRTLSTQKMTIDSAGKVGIGTTSPAYKLDVNSRWPVLLGSDYNADGTRTTSVTKLAITSSLHYNTSEEPVIVYNCYNDSTSSNINIGGGDGNFNAATKIRLITAANNTTAGGTNRVIVDENGYVYMYYLQSSAGNADLRYNTSTGELTYDTSAAKYKTNIRNNPDTNFIYDIPVVMYDRVNGSKLNEIGIVADELLKIKPEYCCFNENEEIETYNKSDLVPALISEIQKHQKLIESLQQEILELKAL